MLSGTVDAAAATELAPAFVSTAASLAAVLAPTDDEGEESAWSVLGRVDLRGDTDPAGRVVRVLEITDT